MQKQEQEFLFHCENGLDTRTSEASTNGSRSSFYLLLCLLLCLLQHFSCENETGSWRLKNVVELYFLPTTQSTRFGFVCGFTKNAEAEGSLKKGFQKLCVCSLFFMMVPLSLDTRSLCLFLYLFIIPALIRVSWPHQIFFGVNFSCFS